MSEEKQDEVIFTPKVEEEGRIDEFPESTELPIPEAIDPVSIAEEIKAEIEAEEKNEGVVEGAVEGAEDDTADDLKKKTYAKITPTFYVKPAGTEKNKEGEEIKLYKVLNPETNVVEKRELTDIEKHQIVVRDLKESRIKFHPIKHGVKTTVTEIITAQVGNYKKKRLIKDQAVQTNVTTHQFGADYRKVRKRKNKIQRDSRKLARKK